MWNNIKEKSENISLSISNFSNLDKADKEELEKVLKFGQKAIGTLESLVDAVLEPITNAKKELYQSQNPEKVNEYFVKLVTDFYGELDEAQEIVYRFSKLSHNFESDIKPIPYKYCTSSEIIEWREIIGSTEVTRSLSYNKVETLIPKIEDFINTKGSLNHNKKLTFEEIKDYINENIDILRSTKKDLQLVKANFLQLSGLKGITNISTTKLTNENRIKELDFKLNSIKELVASSRIEAALEKLEELCLYNYPEIIKDIVLLQGQFSKRNRDFYTGLDNDKLAPNRINYGILEIIKEIVNRETRV